jgi:hypothetical protein
VTICAAGAPPFVSSVTFVTVSSVRPLNCVTLPVASTVSPMANGPALSDVLKRSMPAAPSWM